MNITGYSVEKLKDPTGILTGERFEYILDLDIDEEDELYSENGVGLRVLFYKNGDDSKILNYYFLSSDQILEFALEGHEEKEIEKFCNEHTADVEE
jgi:hypothetical protein